MPEICFTVRWPDGSTERCYSPSGIISEWITPGQSYSTLEFLARTRGAMRRASARVKEKYGFECGSRNGNWSGSRSALRSSRPSSMPRSHASRLRKGSKRT